MPKRQCNSFFFLVAKSVRTYTYNPEVAPLFLFLDCYFPFSASKWGENEQAKEEIGSSEEE